MLSLLSPFHSVQGPGPWDGTALFQSGFSLLNLISLETPSETCQELCPLDDSQSSRVDNEDKHFILHIDYGESFNSTSLVESFGLLCVHKSVSTEEPPGSGRGGTLFCHVFLWSQNMCGAIIYVSGYLSLFPWNQ